MIMRFINLDWQRMRLYGAYPLRVQLQAPIRMLVPHPQIKAFNKLVSSVRVSVEKAVR